LRRRSCWHVSRATEPTLIGSLSNYAGLTTLTVAVTWVATVVGGCATQTEPCHIGGMFTYDVTATGPLGFQVSVTRPHPRGTNLIDDFGSLQEAEVFADRMREIDTRGEPAGLGVTSPP
jgi:hypothetical protein